MVQGNTMTPVGLRLAMLLLGLAPAACESTLSDTPDAVADASAEPGQSADGAPDVSSESPSGREVRFHVVSAAAVPLYLALDGRYCSPWQVERKEGTVWKKLGLRLSEVDEACGCNEQCHGRGNQSTSFRELEPGEELIVRWDAKELGETTRETYGCPDGDTWTRYDGESQQVPAGHYRITVGLESKLRQDCSYSETNQQWSCPAQDYGYPQPIEPLCPASLRPGAQFDLPESGSLDVTVAVGDSGPCEPLGTWTVKYTGCEQPGPGDPDVITIVPDADGGLTGTMTTHLPPGSLDPQESSTVSIDPVICQLTAASQARWSVMEELWCDLREVTAQLHGDAGEGVMEYVSCRGFPPTDHQSLHATCTATLTRQP